MISDDDDDDDHDDDDDDTNDTRTSCVVVLKCSCTAGDGKRKFGRTASSECAIQTKKARG